MARLQLPVPWRRFALGLMLCASALVLSFAAGNPAPGAAVPTRVTLVMPDGWSEDDVHALAWQDAAAEVGFPLEVLSASQLMRQGGSARAAALIVPDSVHRTMNDAFIAHLRGLVHAGARLMLVHDAGVAGMDGRYHPRQSRLSALAGVRYALYGELKAHMLTDQVAWLDVGAMPLLRLPPGKLMREDSDSPLTSSQPAPEAGEELAVVSYHYGRLRYPVFTTEGEFDGQRLMHAQGGSVLAGVRQAGAGEVLFVNLPLTYLKLRTDGFFLHAFLRYFAQDMARLPQLSPMPRAQGALIMNWHIDAAAAVPAMQKLSALGVFDQGPFSMHITAGPDLDVPGDGGGMDLANNTTMQAWVRLFAQRGDEIGSHGGWIHNEFGRLIGTQLPARSTEMIERNSAVVSQASGQPVREYSAPTGNHPAWVTPWLRQQGIKAYYFTGDIGMAPTRSFQEGKRGPQDMWAFPVLSYGSHATFEEAHANQIPEASLAAWLIDVADYCAANQTVRLVYFHPPGIAIFPQAFARWLQHTRELVRQGRLRWMTMAQYADFANRRLLARWSLSAESRGADQLHLRASHPESLDQLSWLLPAALYARPELLQGPAQVQLDGKHWRITAGATKQLVLSVQPLAPPAANDASSPAGPT